MKPDWLELASAARATRIPFPADPGQHKKNSSRFPRRVPGCLETFGAEWYNHSHRPVPFGRRPMGKAKRPEIIFERASDLLERLGDIPLERIRLQPPPGTATEEDALRAEARYHRLCELIDGTLVEKTVGWYESHLACAIFGILEQFSREHRLGFLTGESGLTRVEPGQLRMPDVSFYSWSHFPDHRPTTGQILNVVPDLAIEVLSPSNTPKEMKRKRKEYFLGGSTLVWEVNPIKKTVRVYNAPDESRLVREKGTLDGGTVLPGFKLSVVELFQRAEVWPEDG